MKIPIAKLLLLYRSIVVTGSLLALLICGGSAVGHQVTVAPPAADQTTVSPDPALVETAVEEADRHMDTGGSGRSGTAAYYMSGVLAKPANDDSRFRRGEPITTPQLTRPESRPSLQSPASTSSGISSSLGRQFTLVGAKPSGTS